MVLNFDTHSLRWADFEMTGVYKLFATDLSQDPAPTTLLPSDWLVDAIETGSVIMSRIRPIPSSDSPACQP
ncbi:hypothetical protein chiPu_0016473 [Chiloscyllium punctatum]|uniref:Uncharacterized protein n=1 Tax=Chiloscyllium punctatum TaxID=137246 RepID=A0A401T5L4_CHIPU|nr:hypothetical protein [Chiloscyllium punctatum]